MTDTPMCDKLSEHSNERTTIVDFLEWLSQNGMEVAVLDTETWTRPHLVSISRTFDSLAFEFLGIDPQALDQERRALLANL